MSLREALDKSITYQPVERPLIVISPRKILVRLTTTLLLLGLLCACAVPNLPKIALEDQKEIRKIRVIEKHNLITTDFSVPTGPVSGAITRGLAGLSSGMLLGFAASLSAPHPFVAAGAAAVGGVIGLPL